jgi:beta-glucosidase-like glycosyl hydrolase
MSKKKKGGERFFFSATQRTQRRGRLGEKVSSFPEILFFSLSWKRKLAYNEATINTQTAGGWGLPFPKS